MYSKFIKNLLTIGHFYFLSIEHFTACTVIKGAVFKQLKYRKIKRLLCLKKLTECIITVIIYSYNLLIQFYFKTNTAQIRDNLINSLRPAAPKNKINKKNYFYVQLNKFNTRMCF